MDGAYRVTVELSLAQLRLEQLHQEGSGPFERCHRVDAPSLVYLPGSPDRAAFGCFGEPRSHRSFAPFGQAVVVPAHVPLHVRSGGFGPREMIVMRFDEGRFGALTGIGAAPDAGDLAACVDVRAAGVAAAMDRLAVEMARPGIARETIVAGLGLVVLGELARHFETVRSAARGRGMLAEWQVRRIEARLADGDRPPPDVGELAALCGIGRRHLMRAWKATTGGTVMERVEQAMFARARDLLAADRLPVKSIAGACGFMGQGAFATAFRRRFGMTPSAWRARVRAGALN
ncbi:AraC family transcriptional regulator [Sphingomonas zeicaulis]|uniref:helix-turn-helix domain-containing protein n=1 Tax=Sphingomonas zeicaulis TaxID=1632740 RepID=UPI003D1C0012